MRCLHAVLVDIIVCYMPFDFFYAFYLFELRRPTRAPH